MNEATYNLISRMVRENGQAFERMLATIHADTLTMLANGNGTLREESDYIEREFRE